MHCAVEFLDVKKGMDLSSGDSKKHSFLVDGANHIVGAVNSVSFLVATYGAVADEKPKLVIASSLKGFGRCHEFLRQRFV